METNIKNKRISFFDTKTSITQAKRLASSHFNKNTKDVANEFNYVTSNGVYVFTRINKIMPNNTICFGEWK